MPPNDPNESCAAHAGRPRSPRRGRPVSYSGQIPLLVRATGAVPDLKLRTGCGGPAGVVKASVRLPVVQRPVGLGYPDLGRRVVAVVQVDRCAVGGSATVDVHALAQYVQRAAGLDHGPLLRGGAVAGVDLDRVEVGGAGAAVVDAQAAVAGDLAATASATTTASAAAGRRVRGDIADAHRAARTGRAGRRG